MPWHNDFLAIWIYLGFFLYFVVTLFLIAFHTPYYKMKYHQDYEFLFIATFGAAASLGLTTFYLILYPRSDAFNEFLSDLDFVGKLILIFFYTFAFIGCELAGSSLYFPFLFFMTTVFALNLVLIQYDMGRTISLWTTVVIITLVYLYDFAFYSSAK